MRETRICYLIDSGNPQRLTGLLGSHSHPIIDEPGHKTARIKEIYMS